MSWERFREVTADRLRTEGRLMLVDGSGVVHVGHGQGYGWQGSDGQLKGNTRPLIRAVEMYMAELAILAMIQRRGK